jgi:hypothetical protein
LAAKTRCYQKRRDEDWRSEALSKSCRNNPRHSMPRDEISSEKMHLSSVSSSKRSRSLWIKVDDAVYPLIFALRRTLLSGGIDGFLWGLRVIVNGICHPTSPQ